MSYEVRDRVMGLGYEVRSHVCGSCVNRKYLSKIILSKGSSVREISSPIIYLFSRNILALFLALFRGCRFD